MAMVYVDLLIVSDPQLCPQLEWKCYVALLLDFNESLAMIDFGNEVCRVRDSFAIAQRMVVD